MLDQDRIIKVNIETEMRKSYIDYSMSVIVSRALPDVRDGFKPVHRRILYGMRELGNTHDKPYKKCARIVGEVLGKYHPHGDSSVYGALVRMAQEWSMRYTLVDGQGNFGSVDGDSAAAMRYTEARLQLMGEAMMDDLEKETVDMMNNFDDTLREPTVMPTKIPNLLVNGASGIAVGMATNIPTHNLGEVIDACVAYIDNRDIDIDGLMEYIKAPDFPTGGFIYGMQGVRDAYETGRGRVIMRARAEIEPGENHDKIVITEIPYGVNKAELIKQIADLVNDKKIEGISNANDESDREGMRIVVDVKRDANANVVLNKLFKMTPLQTSFSVNCIALVKGRPKLLSLKDCISNFVNHRHDVVIRRTQYDLRKAEERAHILEGLLKALDHIDEVIQIIRSSQTPQISKDRLIERFGLTDVQAQAIIDMRLRALTGLEREKLEAEHQELLKKIAELKAILADEKRLLGVIRSELLVIKDKYGDDRRSKIGYDEFDISMEDMIPRENTIIAMTNLGYIKRMTVDNFKAQNRGGRGIKGMQTIEEDFIADLLMTTTHHYVMFFTNFGRVYRLKAYEIPEAGRTARGTAIINLLQLAPEEKISAIIPVKDYEKDDNLFMVTRKGIVKKTPILEYSNVRKNGLAAINLREDDELIEVKVTNADSEIFLVTRDGMCIRFKETDVRNTGRTSMGVIGMTLSDNDEIVGMQLDHQGDSLLIVSENGMGKRTSMDEFTVQHRGGKGVKCYKITEKTGYVIGVKAVTDENEIMMITTEGIIIQIRMDDVSQLGRITSGVKLINLDAGVTVAQIAKVREKVSDGNQEFDDVDDAMEDVSKPSEVDQEEDDDPAEEHITMPEETEEDE